MSLTMIPETNLPEKALSITVQLYGMTQHHHLFTSRQLTALTTFSDLVIEARERVKIACHAEKGCERSRRLCRCSSATYLACAYFKIIWGTTVIQHWRVGMLESN